MGKLTLRGLGKVTLRGWASLLQGLDKTLSLDQFGKLTRWVTQPFSVERVRWKSRPATVSLPGTMSQNQFHLPPSNFWMCMVTPVIPPIRRPGIERATFQPRVRRCNHWAIPTLALCYRFSKSPLAYWVTAEEFALGSTSEGSLTHKQSGPKSRGTVSAGRESSTWKKPVV